MKRVRRGETEFGVERKGVAGNADDSAVFVFREAALGGQDQNLVTEVFELLDGLAESRDNSVDFGNKGFSKESDSHLPCRLKLSTECNRAYHDEARTGIGAPWLPLSPTRG